MGNRENRKRQKTGGPPAESNWARKKREKRLGLRSTVHDLQPEEPTPAFKAAAASVENPSKDRAAIVTAAYKNAGAISCNIMGLDFFAIRDPSLSSKPCFFAAQSDKGRWSITRYVGDTTPEGTFKGTKETQYVGNDYALRRVIIKAFGDWALAQNQGNLVSGLNPLFKNAQNIYARRPENNRRPNGPS